MDLVSHPQRLCVVADNALLTLTKVIADKLGLIAPLFKTKMEHKMGVITDGVLLSATTRMSL